MCSSTSLEERKDRATSSRDSRVRRASSPWTRYIETIHEKDGVGPYASTETSGQRAGTHTNAMWAAHVRKHEAAKWAHEHDYHPSTRRPHERQPMPAHETGADNGTTDMGRHGKDEEGAMRKGSLPPRNEARERPRTGRRRTGQRLRDDDFDGDFGGDPCARRGRAWCGYDDDRPDDLDDAGDLDDGDGFGWNDGWRKTMTRNSGSTTRRRGSGEDKAWPGKETTP